MPALVTKEDWEVKVFLGDEEDIGTKFNIVVIQIDKKDNSDFEEYFKKARETGDYLGLGLPSSAEILDEIEVERI